MIVAVAPARLRRYYGLLVVAVALFGGWIWFGNAGAALITLWCAARPPWRAEAFLLTSPLPEVSVIEPWRLVFRDDGAWIEVFRDEVSAEDWTLLRRQVLAQTSEHSI